MTNSGPHPHRPENSVSVSLKADSATRTIRGALTSAIPQFEAQKGEPLTSLEAESLGHIAQIAGQNAEDALQALLEFGRMKNAPITEEEILTFLKVARAVRDTMVTQAFVALTRESREIGTALTVKEINARRPLLAAVSRACASPEAFGPVLEYLRGREKKGIDAAHDLDGIQAAILNLAAATREAAAAAIGTVSESEVNRDPLSRAEIDKLCRPSKIIADNSPGEPIFDALTGFVRQKGAPMSKEELDWMSRISRETKKQGAEAVTALTLLTALKQASFSADERTASIDIVRAGGAQSLTALARLGQVKGAGFTEDETIFFVSLALEKRSAVAGCYLALADFAEKRASWLAAIDFEMLEVLALGRPRESL